MTITVVRHAVVFDIRRKFQPSQSSGSESSDSGATFFRPVAVAGAALLFHTGSGSGSGATFEK